jgi:outer membrane protein OmpA-like peptidoglycan-associated protein
MLGLRIMGWHSLLRLGEASPGFKRQLFCPRNGPRKGGAVSGATDAMNSTRDLRPADAAAWCNTGPADAATRAKTHTMQTTTLHVRSARRKPHWLLAAALSLAAGGAAAQAAAPLAQTSVEALVKALSGGPATTRAFRRTQLPEAGTALCAGQAGPAPGAAATAPGDAPANGGTARNLEVVPYAGDTTPGVNLDVRFATASDKLTKTDQALLDTLAKALKSKDLAQDRFAVAGHTDSTGDDKINQELSCARALAVRRYLQGKGVAVARLSAYGFGSGRPLEAGQPDAAANRRVEIRKAPE